MLINRPQRPSPPSVPITLQTIILSRRQHIQRWKSLRRQRFRSTRTRYQTLTNNRFASSRCNWMMWMFVLITRLNYLIDVSFLSLLWIILFGNFSFFGLWTNNNFFNFFSSHFISLLNFFCAIYKIIFDPNDFFYINFSVSNSSSDERRRHILINSSRPEYIDK